MNLPQHLAIASGSSRVMKPSQFSAQRLSLSVMDGSWQGVSKSRLEELVRLQEGWDGYAAFPVSFDNAMFAYRMLESISRRDTPAPQIVPGSSGDLQIEWHLPHGDIELWVRGPNSVHAWRSINDGNGEEEVELTTDFSLVAGWIREITEPTIAIAAAA